MKNLLSLLVLCFVSQTTWANVVGSDLQNFNPNTNGLDFVTVHSSATLDQGQLNLGTFLNFATNSLPYSILSPTPNSQSLGNPNDMLLYSKVHIAGGILEGWDFGFTADFINMQNIQEANFLFNYGDMGLNDFRLNSKARLYKTETFGFAVNVSGHFDQIKNNPFSGDAAGPTINFEGIADYTITPDILFAVNLGYRMRLEGSNIPNSGMTPMPDQIIYSSALSYKTDDMGSAIIGEVYGSLPIEQFTQPTDRELSNMETLVGYRWRNWKDIDIHGGVGSAFYNGIGSPDLRVYAGVNWRVSLMEPAVTPAIEPTPEVVPLPGAAELDADTDGVPDAVDLCPNTWTQNYVDKDGCNDEQQKQKQNFQDTESEDL